MIEIDDNLKPEPPEPEPAKPILASSLLELEEKQRTRFLGNGESERIKTGCTEIDGLFDGEKGGGIERGIIFGISADGGDGRLISLHLLASVLLSRLPSPSFSATHRTKPRATIIDTTGSFPLSLLAKVLKSRILESRSSSALRAVNTANYTAKSGKDGVARNGEEEDVEKEVQRCLEMVALSRVFDIEGLWEVLGEVGRNTPVHEEPNPSFSGEAEQQDATASQDGETQAPEKPAEIIDSDQEEVLSPVKEAPLKLTPAPPPKSLTPSGEDEDEGTEIIIIDNMTHIINELFSRKEKSDAHTLLTLLSRTMHTLTHTSNILTILHNTTVPAKSSFPQTSTSKTRTQPQAQISVFMSNPIKPALGQIFSQLPEVHLLLSKMPKKREDAEVLYGGDDDPSDLNNQREKVENCTVIEVLKDEAPLLGSDRQVSESKRKKEFGWREGNWTAVEVSDDGLRFVGAFEEKGDMKGIGMMHGEGTNNATRGLENEVSNIAKIWGFSGRRV